MSSRFIFSTSFVAIILFFHPFPSIAETITVGHGAGYDYQTITEALVATSSGDTIMVADGEYTVSTGETFPLVMKQGILLKRENNSILPKIDASGSGKRVITCENIAKESGTGIEGFYIIGGEAKGYSSDGYGGGIYL